MPDFAHHLAHEARRLGLETDALEDVPPEALHTFAQVVLDELAARGLLQGREEVGCWAAPRMPGH